MRQSLIITILLLLSALSLGQLLQRSELADHSAGKGIVGRIFGETRDMLGQQMIRQADLYFHGGIKYTNCEHGLSVKAGRQKKPRDAQEHEHPPPAAGYEHVDGKNRTECTDAVPDDWLTLLNKKIHPRSHKHLSSENSEKEILPWLWAGVKADPHNIKGYNIGAYWLANRLSHPQEALELLRKGINRNPESYRLELTRGEILWRNLENKKQAVKAFEAARKKFLAEFQPEEKTKIANIPGQDRLFYDRILIYLADYAHTQGQNAQAVEYLQEAIPYANNPDHLRSRIRKLR